MYLGTLLVLFFFFFHNFKILSFVKEKVVQLLVRNLQSELVLKRNDQGLHLDIILQF